MITKLLFLALFVIFPFGQLARLPLAIPGVNLYGHDLIVSLILLSWLGDHILKKKKIALPPLAKPIFGFVAVALLSWLLNIRYHSSEEIMIAFLYLLRWTAYAGIYFVIYENLWLHGYIVTWLIGAGVASAIPGLLQYIFLPDTRFLHYSGWDDHYFRVIAPFLDPGFTGMILVLTLILLTEKLWRQKSISHGAMWLCCYVAMSLTYSRSAYLAYLVGMGVIAWLKRSGKFFVTASLLLAITILLLPRPGGEGVKLERTSSIQARIENYKHSLKIMSDHPIFGVGFNFYRYAQRDYGFLSEDWQGSHSGAGADSSLLFVLATTGIIGFAAYLWLLWRVVKIRPAASLALIAHSFFNHSLFYSWIMLWLWILISLSVLLPARSLASKKILFSPSARVKE